MTVPVSGVVQGMGLAEWELLSLSPTLLSFLPCAGHGPQGVDSCRINDWRNSSHLQARGAAILCLGYIICTHLRDPWAWR